jgi:hypothetical protein
MYITPVLRKKIQNGGDVVQVNLPSVKPGQPGAELGETIIALGTYTAQKCR